MGDEEDKITHIDDDKLSQIVEYHKACIRSASSLTQRTTAKLDKLVDTYGFAAKQVCLCCLSISSVLIITKSQIMEYFEMMARFVFMYRGFIPHLTKELNQICHAQIYNFLVNAICKTHVVMTTPHFMVLWSSSLKNGESVTVAQHTFNCLKLSVAAKLRQISQVCISNIELFEV